MRTFFVYIDGNKSATVLYTGVTNNLNRRMSEHKNKIMSGSFTAKYNVDILLYYETFPTAYDAISAEKKIKGWTRKKKYNLIRSINPKFEDLLQSEE